jgi:hypothetical protein
LVSLFFEILFCGLQDLLCDGCGARGAGLYKSDSVRVSVDGCVVECDGVFFFGEKK